MSVISRTVVFPAIAICGALAAGVAGCKDQRIDQAPDQPRDVHVVAPGADIKVPAEPLVPHSGGVDVNVGPGGVKVDVDGEPLRERLRERRVEENGTP